MLPQRYDAWKTSAPEAKEPEPVCECDYCGADLFAGDEVIRFQRKTVCSAECFLYMVRDQHDAEIVKLPEAV